MLHIAVQMARHRITALLAVVCAVLGGAALITGTGVLTESGLRSELPPGRLGGADILVSADQTFRRGADLPITLPERGAVPASLVERLAQLPGVTAVAGDISFPAGVLDAKGRVVPVEDPRTAGHNWSSYRLLDGPGNDGPGMEGRQPAGSGEIALDSAVAAAAGVRPGGEIRVVAAGRAAADYRVSAVIDAPGAGVLFADPTAADLAVGDASSGPGFDAGSGSGSDAEAEAEADAGSDAGSRSGSDAEAEARSGSDSDTGSGSDSGSDAEVGSGSSPGPGPGPGSGSDAGSRSGSGSDASSRPGSGSDAEAVARSGPRAGTVDLIGIRTEPGATDTVAAAVRAELRGSGTREAQLPGPGLVVATGTERGDLAAPDAVAARSLLILLATSLAGIILLITGFVMAGALGVAIAGQRRELALMRAVGATPKQIRRIAASQATVIAAAALVPGIPLGYLLAGQFRRLLVDRGVLPEALPLTFGPLPALATILLLALAVQVSARGAAWRTSRMPATEAVAESRSEPRHPSRIRTRAGLLLIVAATTLSVVPLLSRTALGATTTSLGGIIAAIGLALAGPALIRRVSDTLARRLPAGASPATWLAMSNVRGYAIRIAGTVSTLAMAVVFTLTYTLAQTTVLTATTDDVRTGTLAQERLTAPGLGGLPEDTLAAVRDTAGVREAAPVSGTTVLWPYEQLGDPVVESASAMILTPAAPDVLDLDVRSGSLARLTGDTVAVGAEAARSRGATVGQRIRLILGDGTPVTPRVVAVYGRDLGFGPVVLSRDLAMDHTTTRLDQSILIRTEAGADARTEAGADARTEAEAGARTEAGAGGAGRDSLDALVSARPGLALAPADTTGAGLDDAPPEVWINLAVIVVLLGYLLLSIANKLTATTAQRRTEIATLRLNGTTPRQIRAMMRREAALIATAALTAGLAVSAIPLALLGIGFLDRPWPAGPVWLLPGIALTIVTIAFLTIELPTRRALRTAPAEALANRE